MPDWSEDEKTVLRSALAKLEGADATFDSLVGEENPDDVLDRIGPMSAVELRRIVLARVVAERRRRTER